MYLCTCFVPRLPVVSDHCNLFIHSPSEPSHSSPSPAPASPDLTQLRYSSQFLYASFIENFPLQSFLRFVRPGRRPSHAFRPFCPWPPEIRTGRSSYEAQHRQFFRRGGGLHFDSSASFSTRHHHSPRCLCTVSHSFAVPLPGRQAPSTGLAPPLSVSQPSAVGQHRIFALTLSKQVEPRPFP